MALVYVFSADHLILQNQFVCINSNFNISDFLNSEYTSTYIYICSPSPWARVFLPSSLHFHVASWESFMNMNVCTVSHDTHHFLSVLNGSRTFMRSTGGTRAREDNKVHYNKSEAQNLKFGFHLKKKKRWKSERGHGPS